MVKPGITGLWQVSGRSSLSWEESVRLDLSYVENWSLVGDFVILCKTAEGGARAGRVRRHDRTDRHRVDRTTGGAERVLDRLTGLFPDADVLCLWNDAPERYPGRDVQRDLARRARRCAATRPSPSRSCRSRGALAGAFSHEWALVSSHAFAHHVRRRFDRTSRSTSTSHTPARYLWAPDSDGRGEQPRRHAWPVPRFARSTGVRRREPHPSPPTAHSSPIGSALLGP